MDFEFPLSSFLWKLLLGAMVLNAVAIGWRRIHRRRRAAASLTWPFADARIENSFIEREDFEDCVNWTLKLSFFYQAQPSLRWYVGVYSEAFQEEADAETQLLCLRERQLYVRYNPSRPSEHFIDPYRDIFKDEQGSSQRILTY